MDENKDIWLIHFASGHFVVQKKHTTSRTVGRHLQKITPQNERLPVFIPPKVCRFLPRKVTVLLGSEEAKLLLEIINRSLHCETEEDSRHLTLFMKSIVPHLHQAVVRLAAPLENRPRLPGPGFSVREKEVLKWVKEGKTAGEISQILSISERTVKFHIQNILRKVDAVSRAQAVAICLENGFIDTP